MGNIMFLLKVCWFLFSFISVEFQFLVQFHFLQPYFCFCAVYPLQFENDTGGLQNKRFREGKQIDSSGSATFKVKKLITILWPFIYCSHTDELLCCNLSIPRSLHQIECHVIFYSCIQCLSKPGNMRKSEQLLLHQLSYSCRGIT